MQGRYLVAQLGEIEAVACPCGWARRAFAGLSGAPASVHLVDVTTDAEVHFHISHTEVYVVLECAPEACIELDGGRVPVRPMTAVLIGPQVRHRAVGRMRILNFVVPPFDATDEHLDDAR